MTDLAWLTIADAAQLLRQKKLSPVEYTQALLARIEKHDGKLNAFLRQTPEIALEDAQRFELRKVEVDDVVASIAALSSREALRDVANVVEVQVV